MCTESAVACSPLSSPVSDEELRPAQCPSVALLYVYGQSCEHGQGPAATGKNE